MSLEIHLFIFTHFHIGKVIVKYLFKERILPKVTMETAKLHFGMCQPIPLIYTSYNYEG